MRNWQSRITRVSFPGDLTVEGRLLGISDVVPETRPALTRNSDVLGDPHRLTLGRELVRCQVPERAVWPALIEVDAPCFDLPLNLPGKLADADLHFHDGVLAGLKLIGFSIWERRVPLAET
jgi:hypothetical protein